ncbi:MAG: DUF2812 domain-containing protein [Clostridiales bacterium]|nr:DUF2812 domain-containing protein [Clostridiales bacterium]
MKNPNERKKALAFQPYEFDKVSAYLEDMALQGWKFVSVQQQDREWGARGARIFYFKKAAPRCLHYAVKPPAAVCPGWEFVCATEVFHIFVSTEKNRPPFVMNAKEERETVVSETVRQNVWAWLVGLPFGIFYCYRILSDRLTYDNIFASYFTLVFSLLNLFLFVLILAPAMKLIIWAIRHKRGLVPSRPRGKVWTFKKINIIFVILFSVLLGSKGIDAVVSSAAKSRNESLISYNATFLASEAKYEYTFTNGETKVFTVFRSNIGFVLNWQLQAGMNRGRMRVAKIETLDPTPFGAKSVKRTSDYFETIYIIYDRIVIFSGTYRQEPLTPAQVEEILLLQ